jgi:arachidonate 5-lipoxygenase
MPSPFVDQIVRCRETEYRPITAPIDPHPTRGDWVNRGVEIYKEIFGAEEYAKNSPQDVPFPMPDDTAAERKKFGWNAFKAKLKFAAKAMMTGRRGTHMQGAGGKGTITVESHPTFPDHEFYTPGRVFSCRLRHANASFYDDAASQVRAASLKFADSNFASPLDIVMNTGVIQAFWSFDTFMAFVNARVQTREDFWDPQREYMRLLPGALVGAIESERVAPASYAEMLYHTCIVYPFRAKDGRPRYAKYRLVPVGLKQETGLLDDAKQHQPWVQCRRPQDTHPRQYLQAEYAQRVQSGPVEYKLQIQLREFIEDRDTWEFFNGARVWDTATSPWQDLATVRIEQAMPDGLAEITRMWLGHQPPSLGLTFAFSGVDYRSLAWVRYRVYPWSQRGSWLLRSLGCQRKLKTDF